MAHIPEVRRVSSLELEELGPFRTLKRPVAHARLGIFVAEGEKVVRRLLDSGLPVVSLLLTPAWLDQLRESGHLQGREEVTVFLAEPDLLREIVGFNIHQGVMAVGRIPPEASLGALPEPHLLMAFDGLRISENVGVVVRNCAGLGVDAIVVGESSCSPYLRRAVRNSMGAVFGMQVFHAADLCHALQGVRRQYGTRIVAADPHASTRLADVSFKGNVCIVLGNEDTGISKAVAGLATVRAAIPMHNRTDSLNVGSASAVFLYEAARQRAREGGAP
jgi:tRNA G18 (ribose-2'-O)-methylase SpoU